MEIGHVTQNIQLQAEAIKLGSVAVGAFHDDRLKTLLETEYAPW
ncbi:MAG: nitroreductase family protein [Bacillota bacterium]